MENGPEHGFLNFRFQFVSAPGLVEAKGPLISWVDEGQALTSGSITSFRRVPSRLRLA